MKTIITIEIDGDNVEVKTETERNEVKLSDGIMKQIKSNDYQRFFDESSSNWIKNSRANKIFLQAMERHANELLRRKEFLLLNEVYNMLGMPRTKAGCVVGWIYEENNPVGDNFVSFGLTDEVNKLFMEGLERVALLNFNVDGEIISRI